MNLATFVFAAGQETTTKLLSAGDADHRRTPRHPSRCCARTARRIPAFLEETLRMESPVKSHFRLARTSTNVGGVPIPRGHDHDAAAGGVQP